MCICISVHAMNDKTVTLKRERMGENSKFSYP